METTRPSLLIRIRDRSDLAAWQAFDAIYRPMLYRFARGRGLAHDDAEDVVQHCLAAISDHIDEFTYDPAKGRFKSWLRTLVNNRVRNLARNRKEKQGSTQEFLGEQRREPLPDDEFDRLWMEEHLWHCLRELRGEVEDTTYQAFRAYVVEQKSVEEVCASLNLTANNVYTIKWRMTERIAAKMKELLGDAQ